MADPVLDRLRADRPAPLAPVDVDALWEAGRRRRRRSLVAGTGCTVAAALVALLALPGLVELFVRDDLPPIADQPEGDTAVTPEAPPLTLGTDVLWVAPAGFDTDGAAMDFFTAMDPRWTEYVSVGMDVPEGDTETVVKIEDERGNQIRLRLFRELDVPDQWYVVAVDSEDAPLVQVDGQVVLPFEPVPATAATLTLDLAVMSDDGDVIVTGPADESTLVEAGDVLDAARADGSAVAALLRYRDAAGRLLDARGATFAGRWSDVVGADSPA